MSTIEKGVNRGQSSDSNLWNIKELTDDGMGVI